MNMHEIDVKEKSKHHILNGFSFIMLIADARFDSSSCIAHMVRILQSFFLYINPFMDCFEMKLRDLCVN